MSSSRFLGILLYDLCGMFFYFCLMCMIFILLSWIENNFLSDKKVLLILNFRWHFLPTFVFVFPFFQLTLCLLFIFFRLAKSTLTLIPLLGIHYVVFIFLTDEYTEANTSLRVTKVFTDLFFSSFQVRPWN